MLKLSRLFIIDGIISIPIAIAGYFILPDVPEITKAWYLSETVRTDHIWQTSLAHGADKHSVGNQSCSEKNEARRTPKSTTIYEGQDQENFDLLAYLCPDRSLHVSVMLFRRVDTLGSSTGRPYRLSNQDQGQAW